MKIIKRYCGCGWIEIICVLAFLVNLVGLPMYALVSILSRQADRMWIDGLAMCQWQLFQDCTTDQFSRHFARPMTDPEYFVVTYRTDIPPRMDRLPIADVQFYTRILEMGYGMQFLDGQDDNNMVCSLSMTQQPSSWTSWILNTWIPRNPEIHFQIFECFIFTNCVIAICLIAIFCWLACQDRPTQLNGNDNNGNEENDNTVDYYVNRLVGLRSNRTACNGCNMFICFDRHPNHL